MKPERLPDLVKAYGLTGPIEDIRCVSPRFEYVLVFRVAGLHLIAKPGYRGWDAEHLRFKFGVQNHLRAAGYPIPKLYLTLAGEPIWDPAGDAVVLTDFVGADYDPKRKKVQCAAAARALGWFHRISPEAPDIGTHYWEEDAAFDYSRSQVYKSRGWLQDKKLTPQVEKEALEVLETLTALFEQVRSELIAAEYWGLPHIPIHGEFYQYHCRYAGDEVVAVIDWDTLRLAPRLHDVSRALDVGLGWSARVEDAYAFSWHHTEVPSVEDVAGWMASYLELGPPLSPKEIELFPYVCAAMWGTAGCPGVPRNDADIEGCHKVVDYMRFWLREAAAVRDALKA